MMKKYYIYVIYKKIIMDMNFEKMEKNIIY